MKKKILSMFLVLAMLFGMFSGTLQTAYAENGDAESRAAVEQPLKLGYLNDRSGHFPTGALPEDATDNTEITWSMALAYLLIEAGMPEKQLGVYPGDYLGMADSLGIISYDENREFKAADTVITVAEFEALSTHESLKKLYDALHAGKLQPLFVNGMAQPIFPYTTGAVESGYSNSTSDIIRFCVYVETDYDTDNDGKLDLVKALVQVPRSAIEGGYKAATIYEARPYITGTVSGTGLKYVEGKLDFDPYTNKAGTNNLKYREPVQSIKTMDHAQAADSRDWYYKDPFSGDWMYEDLEWYDYYLVRGYAVVECGGLGTRGSEGFQTIGANVDNEAFKCVIEWLNGKAGRNAYTDKDSNVAIAADWSNGKVGMTGRSIAAAAQFGVATTGVEGLETIVPVAGVASWYEYSNSQGISTRSSVAYTDSLARYTAGRYLDSTEAKDKMGASYRPMGDFESIREDFGKYITMLKEDQEELNGDYAFGEYQVNKHWIIRDNTRNTKNINCSALIVHGLNDYNMRTKGYEQMYRAFKESDNEVKLLLHQDGHLTPSYPTSEFAFDIGKDGYEELLNRWFSHYLYGVKNGIETMPEVTAQDSHKLGKWNTYDSYETSDTVVLTAPENAPKTVTISSDYSANGITSRNWQEEMVKGAPKVSAMYKMPVEETFTIKGTAAVGFSAVTANYGFGEGDLPIEERDALMVSAMLVDVAPEGETFDVFNTSGSYITKNMLKEGGAWLGGGLQSYDLVMHKLSNVPYKIISRGWMDLANPDAGFASATANSKVTLGDKYDYTIYLQPTVYEVEEGHTLALILYTYEPNMKTYSQNYSITVDNDAVNAIIPVDVINPYIDVVKEDWFYDAVCYNYKAKTMTGMDAVRFGPYSQLSRAQFALILYRMEGEPSYTTEKSFGDIAGNEWYGAAVLWAAENGIVTGYQNGNFGPADLITREQMALMMYRYAKYLGQDVSTANDISGFTDAASVSGFAIDAMKWANGKGIITGKENGTRLDPQGNTARAEAAVIIQRFMTN